jgi:repressor LexA
MTERQAAIVEFIGAFTAANGYPPSVREVGEHVGLSSTSSVHHQLRRLEALGVLVRIANRSRAVVLAEVPGVLGAA